MPDTDGLEATRFIRQLNADYYNNIPLIALTAQKREDVLPKAIAAGMNHLISKPIDVDESWVFPFNKSPSKVRYCNINR